MLEITGSHIARLSDEDLRRLVAKLCEAELRRANLSIAAITAGGHQNAPDGGLDVRVDLPLESSLLDFIPKHITGFQVKQTDMPAQAIANEMSPKGKLRPVIAELAAVNGAYVIVSGQGSTTSHALTNRRKAMQDAFGKLPEGASLHIDFYDRDRLARWVRNFPGVDLWLRDRVGEPLSGWRPYGNWAFGDRADSEFLLDDKGRIVATQAGSHDSLTIEQGLDAMREILVQPGGIVRLIGLSGMGKTRLVQTIFDSRVGKAALDSSIVIYTDQSQEPAPSARDMIHRLAADGLRAIVVVDNCNPVTHRALAQTIAAGNSKLSLITVEYDVADDEPEETHVFQLEPASEQIIAEILGHLAPGVSQPDRFRIAEFSGGNARIALALARTVKSRESLARLDDTELFKRLFHQKQEGSEALMRAAEVCSLVYSFDGETLEGDSAELPLLAGLADITAKELFRQVGILRTRDLVQRRSRWRAVLPHAIANRLARQALERIPPELLNIFAQKGKERLLKSFSRRLGYLHDCESARNIAEYWLSQPGWLRNPVKLNELGVALFQNVAPLAPEIALQAIEDAALGENGEAFLSTDSSNRWVWARILRSIAYEPRFFDRAALLLARFAGVEPPNFNRNPVHNIFRELFHLYLSGTHALVDQRLAIVRRLFDSEVAALQKCAMEAIDAMLDTGYFSSTHDFSFGARPRDFGWEPKTGEEIASWYRAVVDFSHNLALSSPSCRSDVERLLATHFRGLWTGAGIVPELEHLAHELNAQEGWVNGWITIRNTIRFDNDRMAPELVERLHKLEVALRPHDLTQKVRAYVLSTPHGQPDVVDGEDGANDESTHSKAWQRVNQFVEELGKEVAVTPDVLAELLPELLQGSVGRHWLFGRGLALGTDDLEALWRKFYDVLAALPESARNVFLLRGFIDAASSCNPETASRLLDSAVADPILGPHFPLLQASVEIDESGAERLVSAITAGLAQTRTYTYLANGGVSDAIPLPYLERVLLGMASLPDGYSVAVDIFSMRLHSLSSQKLDIDPETAALGRKLLTCCSFQGYNPLDANHINTIAAACLQGNAAYDDALTICINLVRALSGYRSNAREFGELAKTLFSLQAQAALKTLLGGKKKRRGRPLSYLRDFHRKSPVNAASPEILLSWAKKHPATRFPRLAEEVHLFAISGKQDIEEVNLFAIDGEQDINAWSPLALRILELAPDRAVILEAFATRFQPRFWSGSLANALVPFLRLVEVLRSHDDPQVKAWAQKQADSLVKQIEEEQKRERRNDESFE